MREREGAQIEMGEAELDGNTVDDFFFEFENLWFCHPGRLVRQFICTSHECI